MNDIFSVVEGFLLYRALIVVFDSGYNRILAYYIFGYGAPGITVIITLIVAVIIETQTKKPLYIHKHMCWLGEPYIWGFTGPAMAVIIFNIYILLRGLRVTWKVGTYAAWNGIFSSLKFLNIKSFDFSGHPS